ncbi:MAG: sortase [Clostridia bacterium]|nr:sortase [Clostridia bacterium]
MNQILRTENDEWIYERNLVKEQKNIFKVITFLVITLVCVLAISIVIYLFNLKQDSSNSIIPVAQEPKIEQEIENNIMHEEALYNEEDVVFKENIISNGIEYEKIVIEEEPDIPEPEVLYSASGDSYSNIGTITIEKINLNMNIISKTTEELMRKSACKLWGADPNRVGNLCIIGHNWRNTKLFSKVPTLEIGDTFDITDLSGRTLTYEIYEKYTVYPEDTECLDQETEGKREVTLITCTNDSSQRYVFHAAEI